MAITPTYYGDVNLKIKVDPDNMWTVANTAITQYGNQIADSISNINSVWEQLKVGWVGTTADQAEKFNTAWQGAIRSLFGTVADPGSGVLSKLGQAVGLAADNYAETEVSVTKMFTDFDAAVNRAPGTGYIPWASGAMPDPPRTVDPGPITESPQP
jgi:uncharacterized protein YukE